MDLVMDDPMLSVGLDFQSAEARQRVGELLRFAELPVTTLDEATVIVGDAPTGSAHKPYLYIGEAPSAPTPQVVATLPFALTLTPLMEALAQAASRAAQHRAGAEGEAFTEFVGVSDASVRVRSLMAKAAVRDTTVLVTGESGTGKDVVARLLHAASKRAENPFVPINCGAIPAELLESELFGHEKGAFTGAITQKIGRFELANGGTLFLDEIGDMPFPMQVKLLRAIEQKSFERIGSADTRVSDVRIIAATNRDLEESIACGEFREDLYYRLNVFPIELAPLRERIDDLPQLIAALTSRIRRDQGLTVRLSIDVLDRLATYPWPGNVRELANLLERLSIQYPNELVRTVDLPKKYVETSTSETNASAPLEGDPAEVMLPVNGIDLKDYLTRLEKSLIQQALDDTNEVVARAADRLHIRRTTLVEKMRKYGLGRVGEQVL
jgi:sigma-54 specific flagellar transcriptional regulator A